MVGVRKNVRKLIKQPKKKFVLKRTVEARALQRAAAGRAAAALITASLGAIVWRCWRFRVSAFQDKFLRQFF